MPIEYDITTDGFYLEGLEKGIEEGKNKPLKVFLNLPILPPSIIGFIGICL